MIIYSTRCDLLISLTAGALNAKKTNLACKQLFDRLVANGKNKKLAIIAVCNKLLKQVFRVIKSGKPYGKNYALNYA